MEPGQVLRMMGTLRHRGPDESGLYVDDWVGLGHTRLSIVDLACGTQPIHDETGSIWIVYNGEVFNYPELRADLAARGHRFYTTSDTEVIVHLYQDNGADCVRQLNGQFAMAIWDGNRRELFLARDRLGIRPLHYTILGDRLVFGSEVKALFASGQVPRNLDPVAIDQVFTFWTTLPGRTAFEGVYELPAGHYMKVRDGSIQIHQYWDVPIVDGNEVLQQDCPGLAQQVYGLLDDAVRIRLRADVPVGCYLSGGLDSSGVTALTARYSSKLKTFGIRFEQEPFDEGDYQVTMVRHLAVDHAQINATNQAIAASLPEAIWYCERPLLRTAPVPLLLLSGLVNQSGMKVVLTGEGADEVFGGYDIFRETKIRRFWSRDRDSDRRGGLLDRLYADVFLDPRTRGPARAFFSRGLDDTADPFFSHRLRWENTSRLKALFSKELTEQLEGYDPYQDLADILPSGFDRAHWLTKAQYLETKVFLSQYLLSSQGDRMAMAHSVEIRLPYLDYRIVEFMAKVPARWKILGLNEKHILKRIFRGILPDQITSRTKHPYRAPIVPSLLSEAGLTYLEPLLAPGAIRQSGIFDQVKVQRLLDKCRRASYLGEVDSMGLVGVVTTQLLYEQFVKRFQAPSPPIEPKLMIDRRSSSRSKDAN